MNTQFHDLTQNFYTAICIWSTSSDGPQWKYIGGKDPFKYAYSNEAQAQGHVVSSINGTPKLAAETKLYTEIAWVWILNSLGKMRTINGNQEYQKPRDKSNIIKEFISTKLNGCETI